MTRITTRQQKDRRLLTRFTNEAAATALAGRKQLMKARELLQARTKEVVTGYGEDGLEFYERIPLTADDRLANLQAARVWCSRAGNALQHFRHQLDRAIDIAERMT